MKNPDRAQVSNSLFSPNKTGLGSCVPTTGNLPVYVTKLMAESGIEAHRHNLHPGYCVDVDKEGGRAARRDKGRGIKAVSVLPALKEDNICKAEETDLRSNSLPGDPLSPLPKIKLIATSAGQETKCTVIGIWKKVDLAGFESQLCHLLAV